jgi:hypothetical protein
MIKKDNEKYILRRFILKLFLLFFPFSIFFVIYLYNDPFMVLRDYKCYDHSEVFLNESVVGWNMYLNNRDTIPFDSFIMGNSCTMAFPCKEWEKYLDSGRAMRLFGNAESMSAICQKLQALDKSGAPIKNVLMILDKESLNQYQPSSKYTAILPPFVSGISKLNYQETFFQAFLYPSFLIPYLDYKINHKYKPYMDGIINTYGYVRDSISNDAINPRDALIGEEGEKYWENRKDEFQNKRDAGYRNGKYNEATPVLFSNQISLLTKIKKICLKHNTSLKIIISPDFNQVNMNKEDIKILCNMFGKENVFDFSGINEYTADVHNYYEQSHYRPVLGIRLLERVYGAKKACL